MAPPIAKPVPPAQPVYQHRHRPDMPPDRQQPVVSTSTISDPAPVMSRKPSSNGTTEMISNRSSGSSAEADVKPKPKAVGGFVYPDAVCPTCPHRLSADDLQAKSARAAAIASALESRPGSATRDTSPVIPSGGVDGVAARAAALQVRNYNLAFESHGDKEVASGKAVGSGFGSARGMKRDVAAVTGEGFEGGRLR
jgi:hypothetical protein